MEENNFSCGNNLFCTLLKNDQDIATVHELNFAVIYIFPIILIGKQNKDVPFLFLSIVFK